MLSSENENFLLSLLGSHREQQYSVIFGSLLDNLNQQLKRGLLMPGVRVFVRWSLALGGNIVGTYGKISHINYTCILIQKLTCVVGIFGYIVNSVNHCGSFRHPFLLFYPPPSFFWTSLLPHPYL